MLLASLTRALLCRAEVLNDLVFALDAAVDDVLVDVPESLEKIARSRWVNRDGLFASGDSNDDELEDDIYQYRGRNNIPAPPHRDVDFLSAPLLQELKLTVRRAIVESLAAPGVPQK